jgi:hypothetical protein
MQSFFKKHNQMMTIVGAFIVFMTFIVKEGLGNYWKQTADAIDTAQYIYGIRAATSGFDAKFEALGNDISILQNSIPDAPKAFSIDEYGMLTLRIENVQSFLRDINIDLSNVDLLAAKLPLNDIKRMELARLHSTFGESATKATHLYDERPPDRLIGDTHNKEEYISKMEAATKQVQELLSTVLKLRAGTDAVITITLADAEITRKTDGTYSKIAWWTSSVLFALGWGVGILGKVYGPSGKAGLE